jgi:spore germination protein YaaH
MISRHLYFFYYIVLVFPLFVSLCHAGTLFQRIAYIHLAKDNWAAYSQLFDGTYTHIITAFLIPDQAGNLLAIDAAESFSLPLRKQARTAGTRVLIAIGGASVSYQLYLDIAQQPATRQRFIQNVVHYIEAHGYDGVDFNVEGWFEGLSSAQRDQVNDLVRELAQAVKAHSADLLVTIPLAPLYWLPMSATCALVNSPWIDLAHHMSYDFNEGSNGANGPWRHRGKQQYLYPGNIASERSVWGALHYLLQQGCHVDKLTAGIPFYSTTKESWEVVQDRHDWGHVPLHPAFLEKADPVTGVWVTDAQAVTAKVQAYQQFGLAGVIVWQVGHEGVAATLSRALLAAVL